jgi:hypothetical protein
MVWYGMVWYDYWDRYLHPGPATVGNLSCCSMSFSISIFISILSLISSAPTFPPPTGVPGTEETKKEAVVKLAEFWKKRCGLYPQGADELLKLAWSTVAREAIIDTLINKSGLQLKLSADTKNIYCRVRAPIKLLEVQAHKEAYRSVPCGIRYRAMQCLFTPSPSVEEQCIVVSGTVFSRKVDVICQSVCLTFPGPTEQYFSVRCNSHRTHARTHTASRRQLL